MIKKRYAKQFSGVFFRRYILGLWCIAEGIIYDMFDTKKHVVDEIPDIEPIFYVSSDFGIQNANVWHIYHNIRGTNRWIQTAESVYSGREEKKQRTVKQLADDLDKLCDGKKPKCVIIDPSASAMKVELRQRGYTVRSADNDVIEGITDVQTMLQEERLLIYKTCKHTISEFLSYAWDPKAADRGEDKPIKVGDHDMDATRYFVRTLKLVKRDGQQKTSGAESYLL